MNGLGRYHRRIGSAAEHLSSAEGAEQGAGGTDRPVGPGPEAGRPGVERDHGAVTDDRRRTTGHEANVVWWALGSLVWNITVCLNLDSGRYTTELVDLATAVANARGLDPLYQQALSFSTHSYCR